MSNWNYWKELPYRGQPPDNTPKRRKPKQHRSPKDKRRDFIINTMWIVLILAAILFLLYFVFHISLDKIWTPALFCISLILIPIGLNAGINALNKHLRADDLDEPKDELNEKEE